MRKNELIDARNAIMLSARKPLSFYWIAAIFLRP
jgi:hypothetical protein